MCLNENVLMLPNDCKNLELEEMIQVLGGTQIKVNKKMLSKSYCSSIASKYTKETGMTKTRIAQEIYAHAVIYYASSTAEILDRIIDGGIIGEIVAKKVISYLKSHANPINLGGDSWAREAVYSIMWNM